MLVQPRPPLTALDPLDRLTLAPSHRSGERARTRRRWWPAALGLVIVAALGGLLIPELRSSLAHVASLPGHFDADTLRDGLDTLGVWAPLVYLALQVAQVLVPFLPAAPVTFAGVLLFGWKAGLLLSMAGWMIGSAVQFAAVRRWGRPLVARMIGAELLDRYAGRLDPRGWWLFATFLVPFAPADAFSALAGLSTISFRRFLIVSFLGRLPWAVGTTLLAAGVIGGSATIWAAAGLTAATIVILGGVYRGRLLGREVVPDEPAAAA